MHNRRKKTRFMALSTAHQGLKVCWHILQLLRLKAGNFLHVELKVQYVSMALEYASTVIIDRIDELPERENITTIIASLGHDVFF